MLPFPPLFFERPDPPVGEKSPMATIKQASAPTFKGSSRYPFSSDINNAGWVMLCSRVYC